MEISEIMASGDRDVILGLAVIVFTIFVWTLSQKMGQG